MSFPKKLVAEFGSVLGSWLLQLPVADRDREIATARHNLARIARHVQ